MNQELEGTYREAIVASFLVVVWVFNEGLRKTTKDLNEDSLFPSRALNSGPPACCDGT